MASKRRVNWISQQRVDVPDMRSVESAVSNDFDELIKSFVTGTSQGYILRGFEISMSGAIGGAASGLQMFVDPGAIFHIASSQSGTFFLVAPGMPAQTLNSATNTIVDGAFTPNAINYVGLEYERFIDDTTSATVYIWNPTTNNETTKNAPRAQILRFRLKISTTVWPANILPIATVTTDSGNNVLSIGDSRWELFRLGTGGASPDPFFMYDWNTQSSLAPRTENPSSSSSTDPNASPFHGGDKTIGTLKDWMNAVMSNLKEIKGTTYWYSFNSSGSLTSLFEDLANTVTTGKGTISHGVLPNAYPVLTTTGTTTSGSDQLTGLASTAGIVVGQVIIGNGIPQGTLVEDISGATVTMSKNATLSSIGVTVSFWEPDEITAPGQVNWSDDIFLRVIGANLSYKFLANPSSTDITLADNEVAYVNFVRNVDITPNLIFTNSSATVISVGAIPWTSLLIAGDWIKVAADPNSLYYQILTVDSPSQVTLSIPYAGTSTGASGVHAEYAFGTYYASASPSGDPRAIQIADRAAVPSSADTFWFLFRADNGGSPRVYVRFIGTELDQGDTNAIDDSIARQVLEYIGSPFESANKPSYTSALTPGSVPEIQDLTCGSAATMASNQYFYIDAASGTRKYYVWVNKNGTGVDPMPAADRLGVEWVVSTGQTNAQTAATLSLALNTLDYKDFSAAVRANPNQHIVRVTATSAGEIDPAMNVSIGAPFTVTVIQVGTGIGNSIIADGDNLTLAIKELDTIIGMMLRNANSPTYDEPLTVVSGAPANDNEVTGPVAPSSVLTLPLNSRLSDIVQTYITGKGNLEVFLNGQYLDNQGGADWTEVGAANTFSTQIVINRALVVGDILYFRLGGGGGGGGAAAVGPQGPTGPTGAPGADAAGGPVSISTKTTSYTVLLTDCVLKANCTGGAITFTLPPAATATGRIFYLKKIDSSANAMNVQGNGAELIDGLNVQTTTIQWTEITVISDGSTWSIL